jgi:putative PIG3 family NAD(P)H quinone oxidoreductase
MRAIIYTAAGGIEVIQLRDVPDPKPGPGQILVRVRAAGLNRADIHQRRGTYPAPPGWPADIPGLEYAGEVESTGPQVTRWSAGDRVMGLVGGGAHADRVVVHQDEALPLPPGMSFTDGAAIPEAFLTAYDALQVRARLAAGERVLIHAVASGVGTAATQVAHLLGAGTVLGTSRTAAKLERAREYGLDVPVLSPGSALVQAIGQPVDIILDVLGGPSFAENLALLAPRGRLVLLSFLQGSQATADLSAILRKRLEVIGTVMRTRTLNERVELIRLFQDHVLPGFVDGRLRPVVGAVHSMAEIAAAHQAMEQDKTFGKVVLVWS